MDSIFAVAKGRREKKKAVVDGETKEETKKTTGALRMQVDMQELDLPEDCKLLDASDFMKFTISVTPPSGYWKGATYRFEFQIPDEYPHKPPKVICLDQIYHPNIDLKGAVCLNILKDDWRPVLNIQNLVHGLIFLFLEPNPADPLNQEASAVLRKDPIVFKKNVDTSLKGGTVDGVTFPKRL